MLIKDYEDLVKLGEISPANIKSSIIPPKYAVIIKTASGSRGKFNIATKEATKKSIFAFKKIKSDLPEPIREKIAYFLKQAAIHHDIQFNYTVKKHKDNIIDLTINKTAEDKSDEYQSIIIDIKGYQYDINNFGLYKTACRKLIEEEENIKPYSRMIIAQALAKQAALNNWDLPEEVKAYVNPKIGDYLSDEIALRKKASTTRDDINDYLDQLEKLAGDMHPLNFLEAMQDVDKVIGFNPRSHKRSYARFLMNKPIDNFDKSAEVLNKEEKETLIDKIRID